MLKVITWEYDFYVHTSIFYNNLKKFLFKFENFHF